MAKSKLAKNQKAKKNIDEEQEDKKRIRSPHPGVKILKRERLNKDIYMARWLSPETGRPIEVSLTRMNENTAKARRNWAIRKSNEIATKRSEIECGRAVSTSATPTEAVKRYLDSRAQELKPSTLVVYSEATKPFLEWTEEIGLSKIEKLTKVKLAEYRDWFVARPAYVSAKGAGVGRGKRKLGKKKRSASQINKCLRATRTFLNFLRKRGLIPALTTDDINDCLEKMKTKRKLINFLRQKELKQLIEAVHRHDEDLNDGLWHSHERIGPFLFTVLLTGARFSEVSSLKWASIDLTAGCEEIRLSADDTKTGHGRVISLKETPALVRILAELKLVAEDREFVFGERSVETKDMVFEAGSVPLAQYVAKSSRKRLQDVFGAPTFTWHDLRRTCGTFLTCAPSIYGGASAFLSAKRLGHSVNVAERHYAGALTNIAVEAVTLEAAMGIADILNGVEVQGRLVDKA